MERSEQFLIAVFAVCWIIAFAKWIGETRKHMQMFGFIKNYDDSRRECWYFVDKKTEEIVEILAYSGSYGDYKYYLDTTNMILTLQHELLGGSRIRCIVFLDAQENGTRIRTYLIEGSYPYSLRQDKTPVFCDFFWKTVLDADPIPYSKGKA